MNLSENLSEAFKKLLRMCHSEDRGDEESDGKRDPFLSDKRLFALLRVTKSEGLRMTEKTQNDCNGKPNPFNFKELLDYVELDA